MLLAPLLLVWFFVELGWFPGRPRRGLAALVLPALALGTHLMAMLARMTRSSMVEVLGEDYVRTARAKGLPERRVVLRARAAQRAAAGDHDRRACSSARCCRARSSSRRCSRARASGSTLLDAIFERDYPMVQGVVLVIAVDLHRRQHARRPRLRARRPADPARMKAAGSPTLRPARRIGAAMLARVRGRSASSARCSRPTIPTRTDLAHRFVPPSAAHWLGTDSTGIDALSQLLWGAREALIVSVVVVAISSVIGVTLGTHRRLVRRRGRRGDHARRRRADGVPRHPAQHRGRRDRRAPRARRDRSSRCASTAGSATRASRARRCSRCASATTSRRRSRSARRTGASCSRTWFPNLLGAGARADVVRARQRDHHRGVAVVPRPRPAARLHVGRDARAGRRVRVEARLRALRAVPRASRSRGCCSARTSSATACATASTRATGGGAWRCASRSARSPRSPPGGCARSRSRRDVAGDRDRARRRADRVPRRVPARGRRARRRRPRGRAARAAPVTATCSTCAPAAASTIRACTCGATRSRVSATRSGSTYSSESRSESAPQ